MNRHGQQGQNFLPITTKLLVFSDPNTRVGAHARARWPKRWISLPARSYLDEELDHQQSQQLLDVAARRPFPSLSE
jgi:hypothetical protein